ncbi:MASE1 domain-containing protein (plasmid) [Klebsiella oxytoca]|uniref:MASE1 domain-containing protein n=1 Tax=Klebsiella oxytoca TaxID=571 RepID=UPI003982A146
MKTYSISYLQQTAKIFVWGLVYFLSALISVNFDDPTSQISIVWFPAGVAVAAFLSVRWSEYPSIILIFALASVLLDGAWQNLSTLLNTLLFSLLAMPASVLIAWIVRRFSRKSDDLSVILLWICSTFLISALDAIIFAGGYSFFTGQSLMNTIWDGFVSDVTGIFFATTVVMGFINKKDNRMAFSWINCLAGLVLLLLIFFTTVFIFNYEAAWLRDEATALYFALTCLPIVLTSILSLIWGNRGGSIGLFVLGGIVIYFTDLHKGPFFIQSFSFTESQLLALSYLSAAALLIVFIRVLRRSTNRFNPDNGRISGVGVLYKLELKTGIFRWENDPSLLLGTASSQEFDTIERVLRYVHPSDREKLHQHWLKQDLKRNDVVTFRIKSENNEWLTLIDTSAMEDKGKATIIGNWQVSHYELAL